LTFREREIFHLVGAGLSNKDIARRLSISIGTTKSHVHSLLGKLSLKRRGDVISRAGSDSS
jgi:two-component system nitrate/nitrite response regulator NarL